MRQWFPMLFLLLSLCVFSACSGNALPPDRPLSDPVPELQSSPPEPEELPAEPEPAATHARLLEETMISCGFTPYSGEWWHFSDSDNYPVEETFVPPPESEEPYAHYGH